MPVVRRRTLLGKGIEESKSDPFTYISSLLPSGGFLTRIG
jgi:hypothetical protein